MWSLQQDCRQVITLTQMFQTQTITEEVQPEKHIIQQRREQFHVSIRKKRTEDLFSSNRAKLQNLRSNEIGNDYNLALFQSRIDQALASQDYVPALEQVQCFAKRLREIQEENREKFRFIGCQLARGEWIKTLRELMAVSYGHVMGEAVTEIIFGILSLVQTAEPHYLCEPFITSELFTMLVQTTNLNCITAILSVLKVSFYDENHAFQIMKNYKIDETLIELQKEVHIPSDANICQALLLDVILGLVFHYFDMLFDKLHMVVRNCYQYRLIHGQKVIRILYYFLNHGRSYLEFQNAGNYLLQFENIVEFIYQNIDHSPIPSLYLMLQIIITQTEPGSLRRYLDALYYVLLSVIDTTDQHVRNDISEFLYYLISFSDDLYKRVIIQSQALRTLLGVKVALLNPDGFYEMAYVLDSLVKYAQFDLLDELVEQFRILDIIREIFLFVITHDLGETLLQALKTLLSLRLRYQTQQPEILVNRIDRIVVMVGIDKVLETLSLKQRDNETYQLISRYVDELHQMI